MDLLHSCFLFLSHDVKFFSYSCVEEVINLKHIYIQLIHNSILSISLILSWFLFCLLQLSSLLTLLFSSFGAKPNGSGSSSNLTLLFSSFGTKSSRSSCSSNLAIFVGMF